MNRFIPVLGFLLLSAVALLLLGFTVYEAWVSHPLGGVAAFFVFTGAAVQMIHERRMVPCANCTQAFARENLWKFVAVVAGALIAYTLSITLDLGAVVAVALVAICVGLVWADYGVPAYCGAFVGMTSAQLLISHGELLIAALIAAAIFVLTECAYAGFGGKLGAVAFTGSLLTGWGLDREFLITPVPPLAVGILVVLVAMVATVATWTISVRLRRGPVLASGLIGLLSALILPVVLPDTGATLAVVAMCASFAGMSSPSRIPRSWMLHGIGLVTGLIFIYSSPLMGGAGGKLGTIAFGSTLAVSGWLSMLRREKGPDQQMRGS